MNEKMINALEKYKLVIATVVTIVMCLVLFLSVLELCFFTVRDIIKSEPFMMVKVSELLDLFGLFMLILIGIELIETMEIYLKEHVVHVEVVFTVAMIAVARKVIILDVKKLDALTLLGVSALIVTLAAGYHLISKIHRNKKDT